jgi:hypothetical protein
MINVDSGRNGVTKSRKWAKYAFCDMGGHRMKAIIQAHSVNGSVP